MPIQLYFTSSIIYILFFITDVFVRQKSVHTNSIHFVFYRTTLTLFFSSLWIIVSGAYQFVPNPSIVIQIIGASLLTSLGIIGFIEANKHLAFSNILSINIIGIVLQQLIAALLLHENPSNKLLLSFGISIIGLAIHGGLPKNKKGIEWALLSSLGWAIGYPLLSIPLKQCNPAWGAMLIEATILALSLLLIFGFGKEKRIVFNSHNYSYKLFAIGIFTSIGAILISYNYQQFKVGQIALLNVWFYPITMVLSRIIFKENISKKEWLGNAIIVLGVLSFLAL